MDYWNLLERTWRITWRYRMLWVFGILVALTSGGGGGGGGRGAGFYGGGEPEFELGRFSMPGELPPRAMEGIVFFFVGLFLVLLLLGLIGMVVRYIANTALLRMVEDYEETGEKRGFKWGVAAGWSRAAWRLFLIDLLIYIPLVVLFLIAITMALTPLLLWLTERTALGIFGTVVTGGLIVVLALVGMLVVAVVELLRQFFWRACTFEGLGVFEAIREGYAMVRRHWVQVLTMWVITIGIRLAWGAFLIIVGLLLLLLGATLGGIPAIIVGILSRLVTEGVTPWVLAAAVGLPILVIVVSLPVIFLQGIMETFSSTLWTLTYRELRAAERAEE